MKRQTRAACGGAVGDCCNMGALVCHGSGSGIGPKDRAPPEIADLLSLDDKTLPRIKRQVEDACRTIKAVDPRYRLRIVATTVQGNWRLGYGRGRANPRGTSPGIPGSLAGTVVAAG